MDIMESMRLIEQYVRDENKQKRFTRISLVFDLLEHKGCWSSCLKMDMELKVTVLTSCTATTNW